MTIKGYGNSGHYFFSLECISGKEKLQAMPKISYPSIVSVILIKFTFTRRGFNVLHFLVGVGFTICIGHSKLTDREIDSKQLYISNTVSATLTVLFDFTTNNIFFYIFKSFLLCVWWIISMNISSDFFSSCLTNTSVHVIMVDNRQISFSLIGQDLKVTHMYTKWCNVLNSRYRF